ncbi:hypothetical protein ALT721_2390010 [Alteromonas alvinellae]
MKIGSLLRRVAGAWASEFDGFIADRSPCKAKGSVSGTLIYRKKRPGSRFINLWC